MKKKLDKYPNLRIIIIVSISIFTLIFWETGIVYPVKLFVVVIHEVSHTILTYLTGGKVIKMVFSFDLSGLTQTTGGNLLLIAASGYLGSLLIGVLLFISGDNHTLRKWVTSSLAVIILLVAINLVFGGFQVFLCLLISLILFFVPRYVNEEISSIFLKFIGLTSCLYVVVDIKQDLLTTTLRETDTQILEYLTEIPALLFGIVWFLISVIVVYFLLRRDLLVRR